MMPIPRLGLAISLAAAAALMSASPAVSADSAATGAANAGATPFQDETLYKAFHEEAGIRRVTDRLIDLCAADPRIADIFQNHDLPHLKRMLFEQFCYLLDGPCAYTGKDMKTAHKDMGLRMSDFNAVVENLQKAMDEERVSFRAQNRLLAKLAPMERTMVER